MSTSCKPSPHSSSPPAPHSSNADRPNMASQSQRIKAYCGIIWGKGDYDLSIETEHYEIFSTFVQRDYGDSLGPPLTMTMPCRSEEAAWSELERMLRLRAFQVISGKPMTREQHLEIFGGPGGRCKGVLKQFLDFAEATGHGHELPRR
ncbi:hypothetical protein GGR57DRAFT_486450 [Xylariaceae sp. FL1272]|nr:hypothetical protein GGR57DRAFT_486450 [Xylariaceae sp. FL1272]